MTQNTYDDKSLLVHVMAFCLNAPNRYLSHNELNSIFCRHASYEYFDFHYWYFIYDDVIHGIYI